MVTYGVLRALVQGAIMQIRSLCAPWGLRKSQRMVCIDSIMLSTTVTSLCQTLRELLVENHKKMHTRSPAHQLAVSRMRSSARVCTLVLFIILVSFFKHIIWVIHNTKLTSAISSIAAVACAYVTAYCISTVSIFVTVVQSKFTLINVCTGKIAYTNKRFTSCL